MSKKNLMCLLAMMAATSFFSQSLQYRNFDFGDKAPAVNCTEKELKDNKAIVLTELKAKELIITPTDDIENNLFYYRAILINDVSVIDKFNKIYIPVQSSSELITLKCRVTKADGKTIELFKGDMKSVTEEGKLYNILALEGLEKNAIIEYFYIKRISVNYYLSEYLNTKFLIKNFTFQIIAPEMLVYESKSYNGMVEPIDTTYDSKNFIIYTLKNVEPIADEKYTTTFEKLPHLESRLAYNIKNKNKKLYTYSDFSKQIMKNYHELEKDDEKTVNKMYKKLDLEDKKTTDEKVFTIESFIKNEMGVFEGGTGELSMAQCIEKKGLSKFYQNKLTTLLLDKCKINYEIVATTDKSEKAFDPEFETYSFLNEILFYIPETKKYLSYESILYRYGLHSPLVTEQKGLFVKPLLIGEAYSATNSLKMIEPVDGSFNYDNSTIDISFKPVANKTILGTTRTLNGYAAASIRALYYYNGEEKRTEFIKELLNNGMENAKVSLITAQNFELDEFKKYDQPFIIGGIVEAGNLTEVAGNNIIFKIGACIGPQSELYQEGKRQFRIYTGYPHSYKRQFSLSAPAGYTIEGLDKLNINIELKEGSEITAAFRSSYTKEGDKITIVVEEFYKKTNYDITNFEGFRNVINAAADFNKITLLLKKG